MDQIPLFDLQPDATETPSSPLSHPDPEVLPQRRGGVSSHTTGAGWGCIIDPCVLGMVFQDPGNATLLIQCISVAKAPSPPAPLRLRGRYSALCALRKLWAFARGHPQLESVDSLLEFLTNLNDNVLVLSQWLQNLQRLTAEPTW